MSKLLGFGLILTGMLIGGVGVPLSANSLGEGEVTASASILTATSGGTEVPKGGEAGPNATPALRPLSAVAASGLAPSDPKPGATLLRGPHPAMRPPAPPQARKPIVPAFETETIPADPALITRAVQTELTRVGCYAGAVTGVWGPDTRRAMKAFTHRVNATLPVDKPDVILLSLLKAQAGLVCGKACPGGQEGAADGRCVPKAVLAQAARKANPAPLAKAAHAPTEHALASQGGAKAHVKPEAPPFAPVIEDGPRMALAGPMPTPGTGPTAAPNTHEVSVDPAPAVPVATPEKQADKAAAKHARKRERRDAPAAKVSYGQTRWAREFFRNSSTF